MCFSVQVCVCLRPAVISGTPERAYQDILVPGTLKMPTNSGSPVRRALHSGHSAQTTNSLTTIRRQVPDLVPSDRACHRPGRRRAAGSLSAWYRTSPSSETLAYLVRLRTDACPDNFINTGVDAPSSAACVSRECRHWCSVYGPPSNPLVWI